MTGWKASVVFHMAFWSTCFCTKDFFKEIRVPIYEEQDVTDVNNEPEYQSKVNMSINPGCSFNNCTLASGIQVSVINVTVHDTPVQDEEQHWLWSVIGRPTVQTAITPPYDSTKIDWGSIFDTNVTHLGGSISYEATPFYSGAIMLMNLIEYDDIHDKVDLANNVKEPVIYPMINFKWKRMIIEDSDDRIAIRFMGTNYTTKDETFLKGQINLTISAYAKEGFGHWLPHLSHSTKTSQVDIQLQHLESSSGFNNSRFALELYVVSSSPKDTSLIRQKSYTLDDEHTPGIFKTMELILPGENLSNETNYQAYLQWRPVVYTTQARDLSESTGVNVSQSVGIDGVDDLLKKSLLYALYGDDMNELLVRKINVTFGSPDDGFYKKTKYQAWTFTFGVGNPIRNSLSPVIILATLAMLGVVIVVIIMASVICIVKKWKKRVAENQQQSSQNYSRLLSSQ